MFRLLRDKHGLTMTESIITIMLISSLIAGSLFVAGKGSLNQVSDDMLSQKMTVLDMALSRYAASHDGKYPTSLEQLLGFSQVSIDTAPFTYTVSGDRLKYRLEAVFSIGVKPSPNSKM